jgi:hypothetical protein
MAAAGFLESMQPLNKICPRLEKVLAGLVDLQPLHKKVTVLRFYNNGHLIVIWYIAEGTNKCIKVNSELDS